MKIGDKLKELRSKSGMTQKELAQQLNVTAQAISRWENDEVEPSLDTLEQLSKIFQVPVDGIFGKDIEQTPPPPPPAPAPAAPLPILALCQSCNAPIYEASKIVRTPPSRTSPGELICSKCANQREQERLIKEINLNKARRRNSFIWGGIIAVCFLVINLFAITSQDSASIIYKVLSGFFAFTFASCLFLQNNFVDEFWLTVAGWGFVRMPGIIFSLDFDGIIFLIVTKIILFVFSLILAISTALLATVLGVVLSLFAYPFAIAKNFRETNAMQNELEQKILETL